MFNIVSQTYNQVKIQNGVSVPSNWGELPFPPEYYILSIGSFIITMVIVCFTMHYFEKNGERLMTKYYDPIVARLVARHKYVTEKRKKNNVS